MRNSALLLSLSLTSTLAVAQSSDSILNQQIEIWINPESNEFRVHQTSQIFLTTGRWFEAYNDITAWSDPESHLFQELLNEQDIDLNFAEDWEKGALIVDSSSGFQFPDVGARVTIPDESGHFNIQVSNTGAKVIGSTQNSYRFFPPQRHFTGEGIDGHSFAMNRPFFWYSTVSRKYSKPANVNGYTADYPVHTELIIHNSGNFSVVTPDHPGIRTDAEIVSTQNSAEPFFIQSNQLFDFPTTDEKYGTIHWLYEENLPPISMTETVGRLASYIENLYGEIWPESLNVWVVEDKGALRSRPGLLVVENSSNDAIFESRVIESFIEALYSRVLFVNELKDPWLTVGTSHYHRYDFLATAFPEEKLLGEYSNSLAARFLDVEDLKPTYFHRWLYLYMARQGLDQPLSDSALAFAPLNREAVLKGKAALLISTIRGYVGEVAFKRGLRRLIETESGSPTSPAQFVAPIRYYSNKNLDWVLGDIYSTSKLVDYSLDDIDQCSYMVTADVTNHGDVAIPYSTLGYDDEGNPVLQEWHEGHLGSKRIQLHTEYYTKVELDPNGDLPDFDEQDHMRKPTGLFQAIEPLRLNFYTGLDQGKKTQINWLPSLKYNAYDGVLLGMVFYNKTLLPKRWEYRIGPEYSTNTGQLTGMGSIKYYHPLSSGWLQAFNVGLYGKYFHYDENLAYRRLSPGMNLYIRKSSPRSTVQQSIRLRGVSVQRELRPEDALKPVTETNADYFITDLRYRREEQDILAPSFLEADLQVSSRFTKVSASFRQRFMLPNRQWLGIRVFAGAFVHNIQPEGQPFFAFGMSGTQDYLYDYSFIGRSDSSGIWSQQFFISDGGFKTSTQVYSDTWLASVSANVPIWKGIGLFGDMGYAGRQQQLYWDYGIRLCIVPDFLEFYFPIQSNLTTHITQPNYISQVRFILNLDQDDIIQRARRGWY